MVLGGCYFMVLATPLSNRLFVYYFYEQMKGSLVQAVTHRQMEAELHQHAYVTSLCC